MARESVCSRAETSAEKPRNVEMGSGLVRVCHIMLANSGSHGAVGKVVVE